MREMGQITNFTKKVTYFARKVARFTRKVIHLEGQYLESKNRKRRQKVT